MATPVTFGAIPSNTPVRVPPRAAPVIHTGTHTVPSNGVPRTPRTQTAPQNLSPQIGNAPQSPVTPALSGGAPGNLLQNPNQAYPPEEYSSEMIAGSPPPTPASRRVDMYNRNGATPWQTLFRKGRAMTRTG